MDRWRTAALTVSLLMTGCGGSDGKDEDELAGPCVHRYEDEIVHIDQATAGESETLTHIYLDSFTVDGDALTLDQVTAMQASNVEISEGSLLCTLPCAFGTDEGIWEFSATALPDYGPMEKTVEAEYSEFSGGCPSYSAEGAHTEIAF